MFLRFSSNVSWAVLTFVGGDCKHSYNNPAVPPNKYQSSSNFERLTLPENICEVYWNIIYEPNVNFLSSFPSCAVSLLFWRRSVSLSQRSPSLSGGTLNSCELLNVCFSVHVVKLSPITNPWVQDRPHRKKNICMKRNCLCVCVCARVQGSRKDPSFNNISDPEGGRKGSRDWKEKSDYW